MAPLATETLLKSFVADVRVMLSLTLVSAWVFPGTVIEPAFCEISPRDESSVRLAEPTFALLLMAVTLAVPVALIVRAPLMLIAWFWVTVLSASSVRSPAALAEVIAAFTVIVPVPA